MLNYEHEICGSNDFQDYFDDNKESRVKQSSKESGVKKLQESSFKESRFKNNPDQDLRLKIQEIRADSIKISTKKVFQNIE